MMPAGVKTVGYTIAAILLWITANLGASFYVLFFAYAIDFALHYDQKQEFIQKMTLYLASTFFAYYLQNAHEFTSIPLLHGLIVACAAHEVLEVLAELKLKLDAYKTKHPAEASQVDSLETLLPQAQTLLTQLLAVQTQTAATKPPEEELQP